MRRVITHAQGGGHVYHLQTFRYPFQNNPWDKWSKVPTFQSGLLDFKKKNNEESDHTGTWWWWCGPISDFQVSFPK